MLRELYPPARRASPDEGGGAECSDDRRVHDQKACLPTERESTDGADPQEGVPPRPLARRPPDDRRDDGGGGSGGGTAPCWRPPRPPDEHTTGARAGEQHRHGGEKERNLPDEPERSAHTVAGRPDAAREVPQQERPKTGDEQHDCRGGEARGPTAAPQKGEQREQDDRTR